MSRAIRHHRIQENRSRVLSASPAIRCLVGSGFFLVMTVGLFQQLYPSERNPLLQLSLLQKVQQSCQQAEEKENSTANEDDCMVKARQHNAAYLKEHLPRFWGNESYIEVLLERLGKEPLAQDWNVFIDIGAGSYAQTGGDISLSLLFDQFFPAHAKTVFAFEPFQKAYDNLQQEYKRYLNKHGTTRDSFDYNLLLKGCGEVAEQQMEFRGSDNFMTANKRIALHPVYSREEVVRRTMDSTSVQGLNLPHVHVLKTDTEGLEWEVLLGAKSLLQKKAIDLIFFAYEDKWTFDSFTAAYPIGGSFIKEQSELDTPNLQSVSTWLDSLGYASYLIGLAPKGKDGFVALPVNGNYWNNTFEVGRDPKSYGFRYTWMDAMAVPQGSPLQHWIEQQSQPHAMTCSQ